MSRYTIKHGHHRAKPLGLGLYLNKKTIAFKVLFDTSCKYHIDGEDMEDINKLFGISYVPWYMAPLAMFSSVFLSLFRNQHHNDSARYGWRYNENLNKIELFAYCYVDGKQIRELITTVQFNQFHHMQINTTPTFYSFIVKKDGFEVTTQVQHNNSKKFGYPLGIYFGGNQPAPKTITIEMKKL